MPGKGRGSDLYLSLPPSLLEEEESRLCVENSQLIVKKEGSACSQSSGEGERWPDSLTSAASAFSEEGCLSDAGQPSCL